MNKTSFKKGSVPWNKGLRGVQMGYWTGKKRPPASEHQKEKMRIWRKTQIMTPEHRRKISESRIGELNVNWKGGRVSENKKIRTSAEYKFWRKSVFKRDNYTCQKCGIMGGELQADHVMPFSIYKDLRFEILNGRTLCKKCHMETDTYGYKLKLYELNYVIN